MPQQRIFVYGTLRPGDHGWAAEGYLADPVEGTTKGALYDNGGFPYADFDGDGTITGDIITVDAEGETFHYIRRVELNAGYVEREVIVETSMGPVVCVAYDADDRTKATHLPTLRRVPDDDWMTVVRMSQTERMRFLYGSEASGVFG